MIEASPVGNWNFAPRSPLLDHAFYYKLTLFLEANAPNKDVALNALKAAVAELEAATDRY